MSHDTNGPMLPTIETLDSGAAVAVAGRGFLLTN